MLHLESRNFQLVQKSVEAVWDPRLAAVPIEEDQISHEKQLPQSACLPVYRLHLSCCSGKWRRKRGKTHGTFTALKRKHACTGALQREREATREEQKTKLIFLLLHTHHFIRTPCSQPKTTCKGYFCLLYELYID